MAERTPREVMDAFHDAMNRGDWELLGEVLADDYVEDYPQSGERIRGRDNAIAMRKQYPRPSMERPASTNVGPELRVGGEDRWALASNLTAIRVTADGDTITSVTRILYPDAPWYVVFVGTIAGGQIHHVTAIFAPLFEPPAWRRQWVEAMPDSER